jgi:uncharacterized protein (TIGR03067 family)
MALAAAGLVCAVRAETKDAGKAGATALLGTWRFTSGQEDGKAVAADRVRDDVLVVDKDRMTIRNPDRKETWVVAYRANTSVRPHTLGMKVIEGRGKGEEAAGIYTIEGDTLKIAYAIGTREPPRDFTTRAGEKVSQHSFVLTREKGKTNR